MRIMLNQMILQTWDKQIQTIAFIKWANLLSNHKKKNSTIILQCVWRRLIYELFNTVNASFVVAEITASEAFGK